MPTPPAATRPATLPPCSHVEVSKMLRDILRRVTPEKAYLDLAPQMQRITSSLLELTTDLAQLFQMARLRLP